MRPTAALALAMVMTTITVARADAPDPPVELDATAAHGKQMYEARLPEPAPIAPPKPAVRGHGSNAAWLLAGTSLACVVVGSVLAYAASSSEDDVRDLYAGLGVTPTVYTTATAQRYQQLIDEGHRYEHLSWAAFGAAGATAIGATLLFAYGGHGIELAPAVTARGAGVSAGIRF